MRRPDPIERAGAMMPLGSEWHGLVAAGGGFYRSPGYFDGQPRLVAVRPLPQYPFVVNVSITEEAALAAWRQRTLMVAALIAGALLVTGALAWC